MRRTILAIIIPLLGFLNLSAQQVYRFDFKDYYPIRDFRLESDLNGDGKLSVTAIDSAGKTDAGILGHYKFVVNGFYTDLNFKEGVANLDPETEKATFLYIKHENKQAEIYRLYYVSSGLAVYIPLWLMLLIPCLLIALALFFRRVILFGIILCAFIAFCLLSGLSISSFFNLIKESASSFFN